MLKHVAWKKACQDSDLRLAQLQWRLVRRRHEHNNIAAIRASMAEDQCTAAVWRPSLRVCTWRRRCPPVGFVSRKLFNYRRRVWSATGRYDPHSSQAFTTATGTAAAWTMQHGTLIARSVAFLSCLAVPPCMSMCTESLDLTSWRAPLLWSPPMQSSHFPNRRVKYSRGIAERFIRKLQGRRKETQEGHSAHSGRPFEREAQTSCLEARNYMEKNH